MAFFTNFSVVRMVEYPGSSRSHGFSSLFPRPVWMMRLECSMECTTSKGCDLNF